MRRDAALWLHQTRHEVAALSREPITLFFSLVFPTAFFAIVSAIVGNQVVDARSGVRVAQYLCPAFAVFGVVMATFSALAIGIAQSREDVVLKRLAATPLPPGMLVAARVSAAAALALVSVLLLELVGIFGYDVQVVRRTLPAALLTLLVGVCAFSALGLTVGALAPTTQAASAIANGLVIPLSFVSGLFTIDVDLPRWLDVVGWVFPLRHFVTAFADAGNPFLTGSGFYPGHLLVIAAWGLGGAVVASWRLTVEPRRGRSATGGRTSARARRDLAADAVPARRGRPSLAALLWQEVRHGDALLWRDPGSTVFAVAFPILLVVVVPEIYGPDRPLADGTPLGRFYAPTMAVYGAAVIAYVSMPQGLARARERGVLQRLGATPVPIPLVVVARVLSSLWIALLTLFGVLVLARLLYDVPVPVTWPGALVTMLLSSACFAVLGVALMSLTSSSKAVGSLALGTLLPLSFFSDIFIVGAKLPPPQNAIGWTFPLRHATRAMSDAYAVGATGTGLAWGHLAVILGWTAVGLAVVVVQARRGRFTARNVAARSAAPSR